MKFYLHTMGCQMNEYDSTKIASLLEAAGHTRVDAADEADATVVNTCHIREKSEHKVRSMVGELAAIKRERPGYVIGIAGCVAQAEGEKLLKTAPALDFAVGPNELSRLVDLLDRAAKGERKLLANDIDRDPVTAKRNRDTLLYPFFDPTLVHSRLKPSAYVTVMKGCDKLCTFCVVPYTRGMEVSRPQDEILDECRALIANGVREIVLLGQNVNGYRSSPRVKPDFASLLRAVAALPGLTRLRYTTSHPRHFDESLARAHADLATLCPYLHLPVQSGSDRILDAMNRGYTAAEYLEKIALARALRPDIALSCDFIVGFPGETDRDFLDTLALAEAARFDMAYVFKYSPRDGTPAALLGDQVPEHVKSARMEKLMRRTDEIQFELAKQYVGETVEVLVEGPSKNNPQNWYGRTAHNRPVNFACDSALPGDLVRLRITRAMPHSLAGEVIDAIPNRDAPLRFTAINPALNATHDIPINAGLNTAVTATASTIASDAAPMP